MMEIIEIQEKIKDYIKENSFTDLEDIEPDTLIFQEGVLDSMGLVNLVNFLREEFMIPLSETDVEEQYFESIQAIAGFIKKKL